jgi:hypothetical protein
MHTPRENTHLDARAQIATVPSHSLAHLLTHSLNNDDVDDNYLNTVFLLVRVRHRTSTVLHTHGSRTHPPFLSPVCTSSQHRAVAHYHDLDRRQESRWIRDSSAEPDDDFAETLLKTVEDAACSWDQVN